MRSRLSTCIGLILKGTAIITYRKQFETEYKKIEYLCVDEVELWRNISAEMLRQKSKKQEGLKISEKFKEDYDLFKEEEDKVL